MRVIAGTAKGRTLLSVPGQTTRPIADRVKSALFSILESQNAIQGSRWLDLFGGTGAVGIEALSRNAAQVVFVEKDGRAVQVIGQELPVKPNTSTLASHRVLWLGPRRWLISMDCDTLQDTRRRLQAALSPLPCLVSDVSDARFVMEVSGNRARSLLANVCALDLDEQSFGPGQCAQTLLVRVPLLLHQVDEKPCFHLSVDRSLAHYAWDWLRDAASDLIDRPSTQ